MVLVATPRDAADVDVGAAGAVEELEVEVHRLVVAGEPDGQRPAPCRRRTAPGRARRRSALRTGSPGSGGHEDLGLEAGGLHLRRLADLGRQHAVGDEEHVAVEAGALVAGPHLGDDAVDARPAPPVGQRPLERDDVVELQVRRPGATATQNSSGVASSVPMTRPSGAVPLMASPDPSSA